MQRSRNSKGDLLPLDSAVQHERAPRPLTLFLQLLSQVSEKDPALARDALTGLKLYETVPRRERPAPKPEVARVRGACLRDHGGTGRPVVLVPSLINPPRIRDLDQHVSLTGAIANMSRRSLLLDWGTSDKRAELSVAGHIEQLLVPLLECLGEPAALIGYCLGGTMAIAAVGLAPVERVATLAAPWNFSHYPDSSRQALQDMWRHSEPATRHLGALPMEVLQAAFWSLDPQRTVRKFAEFGRLDPAGDEARRFVELEEWANEGEALPYPAAQELIEGMFGEDVPGLGSWQVGGSVASDKIAVPALHLTATRDLIAPAATAPSGQSIGIDSGHVGMIVGSARAELHDALKAFLRSS